MIWLIVLGVIGVMLIVLFNKPTLKTGGLSTWSGDPPPKAPPAPPPSDDDKPA